MATTAFTIVYEHPSKSRHNPLAANKKWMLKLVLKYRLKLSTDFFDRVPLRYASALSVMEHHEHYSTRNQTGLTGTGSGFRTRPN